MPAVEPVTMATGRACRSWLLDMSVLPSVLRGDEAPAFGGLHEDEAGRRVDEDAVRAAFKVAADEAPSGGQLDEDEAGRDVVIRVVHQSGLRPVDGSRVQRRRGRAERRAGEADGEEGSARGANEGA